jgi:hypothetical protein
MMPLKVVMREENMVVEIFISTNIKRARAADPNILNHPFIQFNALD